MKKTMKKAIMMVALLAAPFALQAQTKFHDVEANEATGPVKCIKMNRMGQEQVQLHARRQDVERGYD